MLVDLSTNGETIERYRESINVAFDPESVDLAKTARELGRLFAHSPPRGYLLGKTTMRDAVARMLQCSQLEAEQVVDTMVARGFLCYEGASTTRPDELDPWRIESSHA
jgi:hypothetical protein